MTTHSSEVSPFYGDLVKKPINPIMEESRTIG